MKQFKSDIAVEILHHLAEAVIGIDKHHRIRFFNRSAEAVFGFTQEEAIGQPLDMLLPDSLRDVTEWIEADRKLRLAEARQRAILSASPDAILLIDADSGTITDANQAAGRTPLAGGS